MPEKTKQIVTIGSEQKLVIVTKVNGVEQNTEIFSKDDVIAKKALYDGFAADAADSLSKFS